MQVYQMYLMNDIQMLQREFGGVAAFILLRAIVSRYMNNIFLSSQQTCKTKAFLLKIAIFKSRLTSRTRTFPRLRFADVVINAYMPSARCTQAEQCIDGQKRCFRDSAHRCSLGVGPAVTGRDVSPPFEGYSACSAEESSAGCTPKPVDVGVGRH